MLTMHQLLSSTLFPRLSPPRAGLASGEAAAALIRPSPARRAPALQDRFRSLAQFDDGLSKAGPGHRPGLGSSLMKFPTWSLPPERQYQAHCTETITTAESALNTRSAMPTRFRAAFITARCTLGISFQSTSAGTASLVDIVPQTSGKPGSSIGRSLRITRRKFWALASWRYSSPRSCGRSLASRNRSSRSSYTWMSVRSGIGSKSFKEYVARLAGTPIDFAVADIGRPSCSMTALTPSSQARAERGPDAEPGCGADDMDAVAGRAEPPYSRFLGIMRGVLSAAERVQRRW